MDNQYITICFTGGKKEVFPLKKVLFERGNPSHTYNLIDPETIHVVFDNIAWYRFATKNEIDYYKLHEGE